MATRDEDGEGYTRFNNDINNTQIYGTAHGNTMLNQSGFSDSAFSEIGSRSSLNRDASTSSDLSWEMNYYEAAIFLQEGENNEKFDAHPRHPEALPAYLLVHNTWYHTIDLFVSILLLVLAFSEDPAVPSLQLPVGIHSLIEILSLLVIGIELIFKLRWIGWRTLFKHKRTMIKCVTLNIMLIEALVVLVRQTSHFRVTRALRPIFLADTKACGGVRRFIRQILQSVPPIIDMFGLLLFFVGIYALVGFYFFKDHGNAYFATLDDSFVSMFVLLTTANFPDVMMPSYASSRWNAVFFISYIAIVLYVLMNLVLAVVYETFTRKEREKFKKLFLHKRKATQLAFQMLISKQTPSRMQFKQFAGLMRHYRPKIEPLDVILMFKYLNKSTTGALTQREFMMIYDACKLKWLNYNINDLWYEYVTSEPIRGFFQMTNRLVRWKHFENLVYFTLIIHGLAILIRLVEPMNNLEQSALEFCGDWDTLLFITIFTLEILMRVVGLGYVNYISSGWNLFDVVVVSGMFVGYLLINVNPNLLFCVVFRPLRLIRLYKMKKRYRDVFGTLVLLFPLMCSVFMVMLVTYYFFAIIGMEMFASYDMRNCCVNTTVEDYYKYSENASTALGYYYLNNFQNLASSGVTLFELAVVNNWFVIMNAYTYVAGTWSRFYFMLFYLCMMVVLTIVVASVLEAFRFRIQYKRQTTKAEEERMLHEEIEISRGELQKLVRDHQMFETIRAQGHLSDKAIYIGRRPRTREVLTQHMYMTDMEQWVSEAEQLEQTEPHRLLMHSGAFDSRRFSTVAAELADDDDDVIPPASSRAGSINSSDTARIA